MKKVAILSLLAVATLTAACGTTSDAATTVTAEVPVTVVVTASSQSLASIALSGSSSPPVASSSVAAAPKIVPLGSAQNVLDQAKVTAYAVDRAVPAPEYESDKTPRTALDVKVCITDVALNTVSSAPWSLTDDKGGRYVADFVTDGKLPQYPINSTPVASGECIRGWIMIKVPRKAAISGVRYGLDDGTVRRWAVPG